MASSTLGGGPFYVFPTLELTDEEVLERLQNILKGVSVVPHMVPKYRADNPTSYYELFYFYEYFSLYFLHCWYFLPSFSCLMFLFLSFCLFVGIGA
jgi:hypothetical protein